MSYEWMQPGRELGYTPITQTAKTTREPLAAGGTGAVAKPIYPGSYTQWQQLPEDIRRQYQPPREPGLEASYQPTSILDVVRRHPERYEIREVYPFGLGTERPEKTLYTEILYKPPAEPTWKETTLTGQIFEKGAPVLTLPIFGVGGELLQFAFPKEVREAKAGVVGIFESWLRPELPTPIGAAIRRVVTGKPTAYETGEVSPFYLAGGLMGTYVESRAFGFAAGKAWAGLKKIPVVARTTAKVSQAYQTSRLAKYLYQAEMKVKFAEPIYTVRKIPSRIETWFAKQFPSAAGKIELALGWGEEKWLLPSGFETWASTVEAHKFVGYPIIYGKYAGYGIIQVTKPTAFQQIMARIERGMYPTMGGLSARQIAVFEKPMAKTTWLARTTMFPTFSQFTRTEAKTARSLLTFASTQLSRAVTAPRRKTREITPTLVLPKLKLPSLEREAEKFRTLTLETPVAKQKESVIPIPKAVQVQKSEAKQLTRTVQRQTQKLISIPKVPKLTELTVPTPFYPRMPRGGQDFSKLGKRLYGKWFKREHPIITAKQMAKQFGLSMPRKKRRKKR